MLIIILKYIASIINYIHDHLTIFSKSIHLNLNDKQMHFIIIGVVGLIIFLIVNCLFKFLARHSIEAISFVYTFTVLVVVVFAIEIEQKITGRGNMEFQDIANGLWGFIVSFFIYILLRATVRIIKKVHLRFSGK